MYTGWGLVDRIFGHVDLVNKALGLVNKPKWHFEMACMLLMSRSARSHSYSNSAFGFVKC